MLHDSAPYKFTIDIDIGTDIVSGYRRFMRIAPESHDDDDRRQPGMLMHQERWTNDVVGRGSVIQRLGKLMSVYVRLDVRPVGASRHDDPTRDAVGLLVLGR